MLWVITCVDNPNTAAIREKVLVPHREYLGSQKKILVLAGATQNDDGTEAIGSCFVVNVGSRVEAKKFSDGDPFTQNGVFKASRSRACAQGSGISKRGRRRPLRRSCVD